MIIIKQKITHKGLGFTAKEWRPLTKAAWEKLGRFWHDRILPKHFTYQGAREYGYAPRGGDPGKPPKAYTSKRGKIFYYRSYVRRKLRLFGHTLPLVFTGDLKHQVTRVQDIRPTSSGVNIVLHGPRYMYQIRGTGPDKAAELTAVSLRDERLLTKRMDKFLQVQIDRADRSGGIRDVTRARA